MNAVVKTSSVLHVVRAEIRHPDTLVKAVLNILQGRQERDERQEEDIPEGAEESHPVGEVEQYHKPEDGPKNAQDCLGFLTHP